MPIHLDPEDITRPGPEARKRLEAARRAAADETAAAVEPVARPSAHPDERSPRPAGAGAAPPPGPAPVGSSRRARRARQHVRPSARAITASVLVLTALGAAGVWAGMRVAGPPAGAATPPAADRPSGHASPPPGPDAGPAPRPAGQATSTASVEQAARDRQTAQSAATQAATIASQANGTYSAAQSLLQRTKRLASPTLARSPTARDPVSLLTQWTTFSAAAAGDVRAAQAAYRSAANAADDAARVAGSSLQARPSVTAARNAAAHAQSSVQAVRQLQRNIGSLAKASAAAVTAWRRVHAAPPGYLGLQVADPPADWTVRGCEVIDVYPGSPAAAAGLVGQKNRTDPVGDVVASIADHTDNGAVWPVPDCAGFRAAMAQTRAGDALTLTYYHRQVILLLLSGRWVPESGTTTLTAGANSACPSPLSGTITPEVVGNRIRLPIELSGPGGRKGYGAVLDTGADISTFPDPYLRTAGYTPFATTSTSGVVPGARATAYLYRLPGSAILLEDGGAYVPLATGTLIVDGVPGESGIWLGPEILKHGAKLSTSGSRWTLTPPCG